MSDENTVVTEVAESQEELFDDPAFKAMVDAGLFFGRKRSRTNPRMKPYILTNRNEIEIINLAKTQEGLDAALGFLKGTVTAGGTVLFVATQPAAAGVLEVAKETEMPLVSSRWLGGTLTNFGVITTRIEHLRKLKADWAKNAFENRTKKERLDIEREIQDLTESLGGLEFMTALPQAMVVVDAALHMTAIREAHRCRIPVVVFMNTDSDPDDAEYPVIGNTKARLSITWFLDHIKEAMLAGKKEHMLAVKTKEEAKKEPEKKPEQTNA